MVAMKHTNVSELKAKLSEFLARVRHGESVTVLDRQTPIAKIVPLDAPAGDFDVEEASAPGAPLRGLPRVSLRRSIDVQALLDELRGER